MAKNKKTPQLDEHGFRKFGFRDKLAYAAGDFGCNMSFALAGTYFTMFYTQYLGIKATHFATILIFLKIWDAINDPLMGGLLDNAKPDKTGSKFRRFIIGGGIGLVLAAALCFIPVTEIWPNAAYWLRVAMCVFGYLCWDLCYTIVNVPYGTMNAVITDKPDERTSLSTWRSLGAFAAQIPIMVVLPMIVYAGGNSSDANAFLGERMFVVALVLGVIGLLAFLFMAKNTVERVTTTSASGSGEKVNWFKAIGSFFKNRAAVGLTLASIFSLVCMMGISNATTVLWQAYFQNASMSGIGSLIAYLPMFVFIPIISKLVKKFGKQEVSAYTMILGIIASILMIVLPITPDFKGIVIFLACNLLLGLSYGAFSLAGWAMVADAIDYNEYKFGSRCEGTIYATYSMGRKIAQGVGPSLVLYAMVAIGYDESLGANQTMETATGIRYLIPIIYLVGIVGMFVSLKFIYNLDSKTLKEMQVSLGREATEVSTASALGAAAVATGATEAEVESEETVVEETVSD